MMLVIYIYIYIIIIGRESSTDVCNIIFRVTYLADNINNNIERLLHMSDVKTFTKEDMRVSNNVRN